MNYQEALAQVITDGIEAAKESYSKEEDGMRLKGSIAGFEACHLKFPEELKEIMHKAQTESSKHYDDGWHWYYTCYFLEVQWVCNVMSAILMNQGHTCIIHPTYRGVMKAADVIGVAS